MVKQLAVTKTEHFSKRELVLAITAIVVAFSFLSNFAFAAKTKINEQEVERIKTALNIVQTASSIGNILTDGGGLMKILNTAIRGGQTATDVTYGLLVLSAINEMEFMDLVLSQEYKDEARDYFNNILDERTKLTSYWKGVGFDIPKVVGGKISSPMAALTLNTFEITDKTIQILTMFNTLQKEKQYDGLWYYFDLRKNGNEPHEVAWREAEEVMGFAARPNPYMPQKLRKNNYTQLESQFASLYEKWAPYATPYGISKKYKEQLASELRTTLASAIEENTDIGSLYVAEERSVWDRLTAQLANIKNTLARLVSQVRNPFSAGPVVELPADVPADNGSPQVEEAGMMAVQLPSISTTTELEVKSEPILEPEPEEEIMEVGPPLIETERQEPEPEKETPKKIMEVGPPLLCQRGEAGAARQYKVLINEVAWMGSQDSSNDEWIELKNVWGIPVNLSGWQIQDKDQQIKVIFKENDAIPAGGYLLLERSKDYAGALNNSDEALYLFDNNCQLEDEVLANPNWPGGDNTSKKPMQRFNVLYWYTGIGTAGGENSSPPISLTRPNAPVPAPKPAASKTSYPRIIISETYTGSSGNQKNDFVELYNLNNSEVTLTDWYIQRKTENGQDFSSYAPSTLFAGKTIQAKEYFLIANASSTFATTADAVTTYALTKENTLVLKNPNGEVADEVSTGNPSFSKSFGRKWSTTTESYDDFENQNPTPRAQNQSLIGDDDNNDDNDNDDDGGVPALSVVINEIAWAGTEANSADEWIELYNNTEQDIDLTGWKLKKDYEEWIEFSTGTIPAYGYFLLERTDDNTVSDILADLIYKGALGNGGEVLEFYDGQGNLIDSADFTDGWPVGDNQTKQTMERINATSSDLVSWASNNRITRNGFDAEGGLLNGTPKAQNSVSKLFTEVPTDLLVFDSDFTLAFLGSPYIVDGSIKVEPNAKLTIEPAVVIKFKESNNGWHSLFTIEGKLEATSVIFTSAREQPSAGDWDGIYFKESAESKLENVIIEYAGRIHQSCCYEYVSYTNGSVKIEGGNVSIINSTIQNGQTDLLTIIDSSPQVSGVTFLGNNSDNSAVIIKGENSSPKITDSVFTGHKYGIIIQWGGSPEITGNNFENNETPIMVSGGSPSFSGNSAQNNSNGDGVFFEGLLSQDTFWQADLPYFIQNELIIAEGAKLTIEPGSTVKLKGASRMSVKGTLLAQGDEENQIIFTSASDEPYGSYYVYFSPTSKDSILDNVVVRYGGGHINPSAGYKAAVTVEESSMVISNSLIENNFFAGAHLINSDSEIKNTIFRDNNAKYSSWGIGAYTSGLLLQNSNPYLAGSRFEKNYYGIYVAGEDCLDLSGVTFSTGEKANTYDVYPNSCAP